MYMEALHPRRVVTANFTIAAAVLPQSIPFFRSRKEKRVLQLFLLNTPPVVFSGSTLHERVFPCHSMWWCVYVAEREYRLGGAVLAAVECVKSRRQNLFP
jgi:hypothetical protein